MHTATFSQLDEIETVIASLKEKKKAYKSAQNYVIKLVTKLKEITNIDPSVNIELLGTEAIEQIKGLIGISDEVQSVEVIEPVEPIIEPIPTVETVTEAIPALLPTQPVEPIEEKPEQPVEPIEEKPEQPVEPVIEPIPKKTAEGGQPQALPFQGRERLTVTTEPTKNVSDWIELNDSVKHNESKNLACIKFNTEESAQKWLGYFVDKGWTSSLKAKIVQKNDSFYLNFDVNSDRITSIVETYDLRVTAPTSTLYLNPKQSIMFLGVNNKVTATRSIDHLNSLDELKMPLSIRNAEILINAKYEIVASSINDSSDLYVLKELNFNKPLSDRSNQKVLKRLSEEKKVEQDTDVEIIEVKMDDILHESNLLMKQLGWSVDDGKSYVQNKYGKKSRLTMTDDELFDFLDYLRNEVAKIDIVA